jgi:hypothetical protein
MIDTPPPWTLTEPSLRFAPLISTKFMHAPCQRKETLTQTKLEPRATLQATLRTCSIHTYLPVLLNLDRNKQVGILAVSLFRFFVALRRHLTFPTGTIHPKQVGTRQTRCFALA